MNKGNFALTDEELDKVAGGLTLNNLATGGIPICPYGFEDQCGFAQWERTKPECDECPKRGPNT